MGGKEVNIVLLTGDKLEHHYVANKLAASLALSAIIVDLGIQKSLRSRIRGLMKKYTFGQLCSRIILRVIHLFTNESKRKRDSMLRVLESGSSLEFLHKDKVVYVRGINKPDSIDLIGAYLPDLILVYGTGLIGKKIMSIPRLEILNMHTGISPFYRGAGCAFWPIYNEQLEYLGATVHQCIADIDGGKIYGTAQAVLDRNDDMHSVFARTVVAGTQLYIDVVSRMLEGGIECVSQDFSLGKEYRASMKQWWHEIRVKTKIRKGLIRRYLGEER